MTETKTHLIADEKLGGVKREYMEVEREAVAGDYVHIMYFDNTKVTEIRKVTQLVDSYPADFYISPELLGESYFDSDHETYRTLEPTDIVHIDGTRYQLVERNAEVGEKVLIVNEEESYGKYSNGSVIEVEDGNEYGINNTSVSTSSAEEFNPTGYIATREYRVLKPVDSEPAEPTPDIHDLIANLAHRVTALERITGELVRSKSSLENQLSLTQRNVQTFAEVAVNAQQLAESNAKPSDALLTTIEVLCAHIAMQGGDRQ